MKKQIKDPYFEIFSRGGNVEKSISADPKANGETKKKLIHWPRTRQIYLI